MVLQLRGKSAAIAFSSFLVIFLALFTYESCAFYTPSRRRGPASEKIHSAPIVTGGKSNSRRPKRRTRIYLYGPPDGEMGMDGEQEQQRQKRPRPTIDRPTETLFDALGPRSIPAKPKIVVLGATGRIGRNVIRQLMEMKSVDMEIVAFVRNYDKAVRVLYDDQVVISGGGGGGNINSKKGKRGPQLQIVKGDLVPPEELPGFVQDNTEEERQWKATANSAAKFYDNKMQDYDNRELLPDVNESLEDAIRDCTTIISCVGSVRRTHLWHDVMARPFVRLLKADVSSWCNDGRHPFYVNYASTRKAMGYAEREQVRREAAAATVAESEGLDPNEIYVPRIRFIRISDLCVGYHPWNIVPVVANAVHSLIFRYQEMAERLLEESSLVETVVLRPGDLVDEERDVNTTSVQVSSSGQVQSPALIGREDVATLAVAAATFATQNRTDSKGASRTSEPFHYTFGCRWVGQTLDSYPPQGHKLDGHPDSAVAFRRSLKTLFRSEREQERRRERAENRPSSSTDMIVRMAQQVDKRRQKRRRPKPYGIFVALPVYMSLAVFANMTLIPLLQYVPGGREWILPCLNRARNFLALGLSALLHRLLLLLPSIGQGKKPIYIPF
jgi:hypothetical protein